MKLLLALTIGIASLFLATLVGAAPRIQVTGNDESGVWGGRDISMRMGPSGATVEFDCAHGEITAPIRPNAKGEFTVAGTYTPEMGGPVRKDNPPSNLAATYKGTIKGNAMQMELTVPDRNIEGQIFTLTRGSAGRVVRCR